ncbi:MAG: YjgP/YjgQ family permease [Verrucomicrobia bacterium]|nr:YjgP/YjgQ family permease [Verrucomicrobiota bacterium]
MRLLDRYLLRELLVPLGQCLLGFYIFWVAFMLFTEMGQFQSRKTGAADVAAYYVFKTPEMLLTVVPVALLLAVLLALTNHARHHELVAMRAAGIGIWRLAAPCLGTGAVLSAGLLALSEWVAPRADELAAEIFTPGQAGPAESQWHPHLHFVNEREGRTWRARNYNKLSHEMLHPDVEWAQADGTRRQLFAERAWRTNDAWVFENVQLFIWTTAQPDVPARALTNRLVVREFAESPRLILSEIKIGAMDSYRISKKIRFTLAEIADYQRLHPELREPKRSELATQFHARLAAPWTCLVVVLVALPFGAMTGRRNVFVGVAASVFIVFAFYILSRLGMAAGTAGHVPPVLAAWGPLVLFGTVGAWMTARVR